MLHLVQMDRQVWDMQTMNLKVGVNGLFFPPMWIFMQGSELPETRSLPKSVKRNGPFLRNPVPPHFKQQQR